MNKKLQSELRIRFIDFIRLKPYKNTLLTADAKNWLYGMAFLALLLATSEGVIWASLIQNYFFPNTTDYKGTFFPIIIGISFAIVIWLIDAQIVNMDLSYYEEKDEKRKGKLAHFRELITKYFWNKSTFVLASRIAIIIVSVYFTAPALTKLVLNDEVEAQIEKQRFKLKTDLYKKVEQSYKVNIDKLKKEIDDLGIELEKEIAGTRTSTGNRVGYGKVAKRVEKRIKDKQDELQNLINKKNEENSLIHQNKFDELKTKYDTYIEGITTASIREKAYKEVLKDKNNKFLADIAKTAIFLVFSVFLLFKFFQPKTVSNYYNNKMQDAHLEYRRGELDHLVQGAKLPLYNENGGMSIQRFFSFYEKIYIPTLFDDFNEVRISSFNKKSKMLTFLKKDLSNKQSEIDKLSSKIVTNNKEVTNLEENIIELKNSINELETKEKGLSELVKSEFNNVTINENLKIVKNDILKKRKQILSNEKRISEINSLNLNLQSKLKILEISYEKLNNKIQRIEEEIQDVF